MKKLNLILTFAVLAILFSCSNDDNGDFQMEDGDFAGGIFVINEGIFNSSNASVSFIGGNGEIQNNIFENTNNRILGDVAQSMNFYEDYAYIVVNNSNTIEVVKRNTFESVATISSGLQNPRYIEFYNDKGYVSNWGDGTNPDDDFIAVIDLNSNSVTSTIPVAEGPEKLTEENGKLFVAQQGGFGYGNSVSVIDLNSNSVSAAISVADVPSGMVEENGFLYVLCSGKESWTGEETLGAMFKINLQNNQVVDEFEFSIGVHPTYLAVENNKVYYTVGNDIYQTSALNIENSANPIISASADGLQILYGFNVIDDWVYVCDASDFQSNGQLLVYSPNGNLENQIPIGGYLPKAVYAND